MTRATRWKQNNLLPDEGHTNFLIMGGMGRGGDGGSDKNNHEGNNCSHEGVSNRNAFEGNVTPELCLGLGHLLYSIWLPLQHFLNHSCGLASACSGFSPSAEGLLRDRKICTSQVPYRMAPGLGRVYKPTTQPDAQELGYIGGYLDCPCGKHLSQATQYF